MNSPIDTKIKPGKIICDKNGKSRRVRKRKRKIEECCLHTNDEKTEDVGRPDLLSCHSYGFSKAGK